jgi:transposase
MFYCGIDIAKRKHEAGVIDTEGKPLGQSLSFDNSAAGCGKLIALLEKLGIAVDNLIIGMEATGHYWLCVHEFLQSAGWDVRVINPLSSEAFRNLYIRKTKNDSKDSFIIAQVMRFGEYAQTALAGEDIIALRQLTRFRRCLIETCGDCKRRIISLPDFTFPEFETFFSDMFGKSGKALLQACPLPEGLEAVSTRKLTNLLEKVSHGRHGRDKALAIKQAAADSFGVGLACDTFAFQIQLLLQQLNFIENQLAQLDVKIDTLLEKLDSPITTIPGIGNTLGAAILAEVGDIRRFDSASQLVAFAGLDARVSQSGEFTGTQNHISKRGSPYLRYAIWLAASRAAFCDSTMSAHYQQLRARGKHHLVAIGSVARKMCNLIFAILSQNRPFQPTPPT